MPQQTLVPADDPKTDAIAPTTETGFASMIERLAKDSAVDVEKLERLLAMQERIMGHNRKAAFDAAFSQMQNELPEISERGEIRVRGELRSTYAKLEDIHAAVKPVLKAHGFAIRHRTEWPQDRPGIIRIVGILSHEQGHSEESVFEAAMDKSDYRTEIQSMGSTVSYGRRYTTLDLLNIATRGNDDDGQSHGQKASGGKEPAGFADWIADLASTADEGLKAVEAAWTGSKPEYRNYLAATDRGAWNRLKAKARDVDAKRARP